MTKFENGLFIASVFALAGAVQFNSGGLAVLGIFGIAYYTVVAMMKGIYK